MRGAGILEMRSDGRTYMIALSETAAKKVMDLRLEEGKPEWGLLVVAVRR